MFWRRRSRWADVDYLDLVLVPRCEAEIDPATGRVVVLKPRFADPLGRRLIQPRLGAGRRFLKVPLEERGSVLWRHCDGQRTVGDLVAVFAAAFPHDTDDAPKRISLYLHAMYENDLISYTNLRP